MKASLTCFRPRASNRLADSIRGPEFLRRAENTDAPAVQNIDLPGLIALLPIGGQRLPEEIIGRVVFAAQERLNALLEEIIIPIGWCAPQQAAGSIAALLSLAASRRRRLDRATRFNGCRLSFFG